MKRNNYHITYEKEIYDIGRLVDQIYHDGFVSPDTVLVNCQPEYSSIVTQIANHKLSHINGNEPFHQVTLQMPPPNMSQVINDQWEPEMFDRYLQDWVSRNLLKGYKYLFLTSDIRTGRNFQKVHAHVKTRLDREDYMFATVYLESKSVFKPQFYTEEYDSQTKGSLLFQWENSFNPNYNEQETK